MRHTQSGTSLVELLLYIALLSIVVTSMTLTAVSLLGSFAHMRASSDIAEAATVAMERIVREARFAYNVDTGVSTLLVHPGQLALDTINESGGQSHILFQLNGSQLVMRTDGGTPTPLTHSSVTVSNLVFTHTLGTFTEAIRIEMTLERAVRGVTVSKNFETFVVLDAS